MLCAGPVIARELTVGPDRGLKLPSEAAAAAADGDVVRIDPGNYNDCAVWKASRLLIEAGGPGVRVAGRSCAEKGIFVTEGSGITIRGITFADAKVVWHNGAGIRASGDDLTVEHSRFVNNENGILAGGGVDSVVRIIDSAFIGNGACVGACAHGVYAGAAIALLDIEHCVFADTKIAHHVKSRARETIIRDSRIEDGPDGTSSYLIEVPDGGDVLIERNILEKGRHSSNSTAAISIGAEGDHNPTHRIEIRDNVFRNDFPARTAFVRNSTKVSAGMTGNRLSGAVEALLERSRER